jgi:hypothetical protein
VSIYRDEITIVSHAGDVNLAQVVCDDSGNRIVGSDQAVSVVTEPKELATTTWYPPISLVETWSME